MIFFPAVRWFHIQPFSSQWTSFCSIRALNTIRLILDKSKYIYLRRFISIVLAHLLCLVKTCIIELDLTVIIVESGVDIADKSSSMLMSIIKRLALSRCVPVARTLHLLLLNWFLNPYLGVEVRCDGFFGVWINSMGITGLDSQSRLVVAATRSLTFIDILLQTLIFDVC